MPFQKSNNVLDLPSMEPFSFSTFAEWLVAPVRLALLELAIELELPDIIAQSGELPDIAARLGISRLDTLSRILDALVASGLLLKQDAKYCNTELAEQYLRKERPTYLGELFISLKAMQHRNISRLNDFLFAESIPVNAEGALRDPEHWKRSVKGLRGYQKAGAADAMAGIAASLPGADQFRRMLDLGCGPGVTALRILQCLPQLHLTLCDFPQVLQVAQEEAETAGLIEKVSFIPGDYNSIDWGRGYDLIWACQSLYYAKNLQSFLERLFCSLEPGGIFVSIHEGVRCGNTEPGMSILSRLSLALEGHDVSFAAGCIATAAKIAGFSKIHTGRLSMLFGDADLEVFQKPLVAKAKQ